MAYERRTEVLRILRDHPDTSLATALRVANAVAKVERRKAERALDGDTTEES